MNSGVIFDERLRMRRTTTSAAAADVLSNRDILTAPYGKGYAELEARTGRAFPNVRFALNYLPVANDGAHHDFLRRLSSDFIRDNAATMRTIRDEAASHATKVFARDGETDLMAELVVPFVENMVEKLSGTVFTLSPSMVFDHNLSLRKRLTLEAEFGRVITHIRETFPQDSEDRVGIRLAFAILGTDATLGTFGNSLREVLKPADGQPLNALDWSDDLVATGVPFILRDDVQAGTADRIYVDMTRFVAGNEPKPAAIFGVGAHTCLGRGFAQGAWRDLVGVLRGIDRPVWFVSSHSPDLRIFDVPQALTIRIGS